MILSHQQIYQIVLQPLVLIFVFSKPNLSSSLPSFVNSCKQFHCHEMARASPFLIGYDSRKTFQFHFSLETLFAFHSIIKQNDAAKRSNSICTFSLRTKQCDREGKAVLLEGKGCLVLTFKNRTQNSADHPCQSDTNPNSPQNELAFLLIFASCKFIMLLGLGHSLVSGICSFF